MIGVCAAAVEADRGRMIELWHEAFPEDADEEINAFFALFFRYAFVSRVDGDVTSMLFLLPATLVHHDKRMSVGYIYAGATYSKCRGNGLYRSLIRFAISYAKSQGMEAVFLRPADDTLAESYRRMGFTMPMMCREYTVSSPEQDVVWNECDVWTYRTKRREQLEAFQVPYVEWDVDIVSYALSWCRAVVSENGVGLIADTENGTVAWEWLGKSASPPTTNITVVRTAGTDKTIGLLYPFSQETFAAMPPVYMGYGLE